jgi:uncharacterized phage protein gp47/JayE
MLDNLPQGIDKSEGNIPWDFTRPPALEKAEMVEFTLNETVKLMFPQWSYGKWLDLHGEKVNCIRRAANRASGALSVTGTKGTVIPAGYQFATPAELTSSVLFEAIESVSLDGEPDSKGQVTRQVPIRALDGGLTGNVAEDAVKLMVKPMSGIAYVTNPEAITGGAEAESDADYLIRILDAMRNGSSMTGCVADYIRWGREVPGVGQVIVDPEWDDPTLPEHFHYMDALGFRRCAGAVRLIIIDSNGLPANQQILDAVYLHIMGTGDDDIKRLAPIGAHVTVIAPEGLTVDISADVLLEDDADIEAVTQQLRKNLRGYWLTVGQEARLSSRTRTGYVRWVQVGAVLAKTKGVKDYKNLTINGDSKNIPITQVQYPVTGEVALSVQTRP